MVILGMMIHGTMTNSSKKDYLSILGLTHDFDDRELKKAFRREARKWHPDLNKKFAAVRKTDNNPLQSIKNTFGSLKDELFSDDYWDDDPWDNQMNRNYRNSRYGNSRDDDPWDNDYFL